LIGQVTQLLNKQIKNLILIAMGQAKLNLNKFIGLVEMKLSGKFCCR